MEKYIIVDNKINYFKNQYLVNILVKLSPIFDLNKHEVCDKLGLYYFNHCPKEKLLIPFVGIIFLEDCESIKKNYGLYTQCKNPKDQNNNYCKTCSNYLKKNGSLQVGNIFDRENIIKCKKDIKSYSHVSSLLKINTEREIDKLKKYNIIFNTSDEFVKKKKKSPKKKINTYVADSDSEAESNDDNESLYIEETTRKVGRPKKEDMVIVKSRWDPTKKDWKLGIKTKNVECNDLSEDEDEVWETNIEGQYYLTNGTYLYDINNYEKICRV